MELLTFLIIILFILIIILLFYVYQLRLDNDLPFYGSNSKWCKLQEENIGILSSSQTLSKIPLRYSEKTELNCSNPMEEVVRMGYGICERSDDEDKKITYLVPSEEIQKQLTLEEQPKNEETPKRESVVSTPVEPANLQRAISTDSLDSTCSSIIESGPDFPTVHLILSYHEPSQMLSVQVEKITDACGDLGHIWLLFFLLPHPKPLWRTEAKSTPASILDYGVIFQQCVRIGDMSKIALLAQLYSSKNQSARIVGQCRIRIKDLNVTKTECQVPISLTLKPTPVYDENSNERLGDVLTLISHQKDVLTVVVSKIRDLNSEYKNIFVRVYLVLPLGGVYIKKKTSRHCLEKGATDISESVFFNIPRKKFKNATVRLSMVCEKADGSSASIGHITVGKKSSGKELGHYTRAYSEEGNHLATWHSIQPRRTKF